MKNLILGDKGRGKKLKKNFLGYFYNSVFYKFIGAI